MNFTSKLTGLSIAYFLAIQAVTIPQTASAGFLDNLVDKIEQEADNRLNRRTDEAIDDTFDSAEDEFDDSFSGHQDRAGSQDSSHASTPSHSSSNTQPNNPNIKWAKFDFVPGDTVLFEDKPSIDEENGEFPSRWDLKEGSVEIAEVNGENVIMFLDHGTIIPYLKNSRNDYLPDVFTLEFDAYFSKGYSGRYWVNFFDEKNQWKKRGKNQRMTIYVNSIRLDKSEKTYPGKRKNNKDEVGGWRHISIAFTRGKLKAYMNDTRLINIPHYPGNPTGITISAEKHDNYEKFIKNIRLAKGGVKYYDRVLQDGKIIVNGIRFDVNKANILPESNGAINKIYSLMRKHPDIRFRVEGHTDSDGGEKSNLRLSQSRAEAVMNRLISMGVASNRLQAKGFGESKPIDTNGTAEGRANNRRVEFIKL